MKKFTIIPNPSGVIVKESIQPGGVSVIKGSPEEAHRIANRPRYFTVTLDPDPLTDNTFKVAISKLPIKNKYLTGTTFTITEQEGYTITEVLANSEEIEAGEDGKYVITITEPTDITVETEVDASGG